MIVLVPQFAPLSIGLIWRARGIHSYSIITYNIRSIPSLLYPTIWSDSSESLDFRHTYKPQVFKTFLAMCESKSIALTLARNLLHWG